MFGRPDDLFALEVAGDSMIDEGIFTGDFVICRKTASAENGQLVVAIVEDENATLKRFYKQTDCIKLQAANQAYEPIYTNHCRIEAVVLGLLRRL
ncbi:MAG: repressor LexA, partial [Planctomycetes bacterium]|nr:repressor LexA [Planctomycetota bacterium]